MNSFGMNFSRPISFSSHRLTSLTSKNSHFSLEMQNALLAMSLLRVARFVVEDLACGQAHCLERYPSTRSVPSASLQQVLFHHPVLVSAAPETSVLTYADRSRMTTNVWSVLCLHRTTSPGTCWSHGDYGDHRPFSRLDAATPVHHHSPRVCHHLPYDPHRVSHRDQIPKTATSHNVR